MKDPNPVYDPGAPRSIGGINDAARLCDIMEIDLKIQPPREFYMHGWGEACLDPKPVVGNWEITLLDINGNPCTLRFDLVRGNSVLVIGLGVGKFALQDNLSDPTTLRIKRPVDTSDRTFPTYVSKDEDNGMVERIRVELTPRPITCIRNLLSVPLANYARREPRVFAKRIHRATHTPAEQVSILCKQAGIMNPELEQALHDVEAACDICAGSGRPKPSNKVSLTHVNEAFNMEVQIDLCFEYINFQRHTIFIVTDTGTGFSEGVITLTRNVDTMCKLLDHTWIFRHGAPVSPSADDEYNRGRMCAFLAANHITFKPRPTRRHNKTGIVERKIQTVKSIIRKLDKEISSCTPDDIVARALFLSNLFSGSRLLSSFQLVRGYQPSILGIPASRVPQSLLDAHIEQVATRSIQRALRAKPNNTTRAIAYGEGDIVWVWYYSTKGNERDEWVKAVIVKLHEHYMEVRRLRDGKPLMGPTMKPAYENVRIAPKSALTQELMECSLEELMSDSMDRGEAGMQQEDRECPPNINALLSARVSTGSSSSLLDIGTTAPKGPKRTIEQLNNDVLRDIGKRPSKVLTPPEHARILESDKARVLDEIYEQIGSRQVTKREIEFAPAWISEQAFIQEYKDNWSDAFQEVNECDIPDDANVIRSHVVYKVKTDETGTRKMKARLCPHGNEDDEKDQIRKDSANAQLNIVRLLLSLVTFLNFEIRTADIKGAFLQSGPIQRDVYVRPPREWHHMKDYQKGILWKLLKLPYGIIEAGRQWMITVESWMLTEGGLRRVFGVSQLFVKRNNKGSIVLLVAKLTDDFLAAGNKDDLDEFFDKMQKRFEVGMINNGPLFVFGGTEIKVDACGDIILSMNQYWKRLQPIELSRLRRKASNSLANAREVQQYRALAGTLLYLGNGVLPQSSYVVSLMQQRVARLKVEHLVDANNMLAELRKLRSTIIYRKADNLTNVCLFSLSDASHPSDRDYGQSGILMGILSRSGKNGRDVYHLIDWSSHKQNRVSHSSYGAEILAAASADDRGFYLKTAINTLFPNTPLKHELNVDSGGLWDTVTTLHEGKEYRLRQTVQRIINSFESGEANVIRWIPGPLNYADALTKFNIVQFRRLNELCATGYLNLSMDVSKMVDAAIW